jgi:hypothetical protein
VSPPLPVELNRDRRHEIRVAERYEADGPFSVDLRNHGDGVHVHVNVDGDLAEVARVAETNHYVDDDASTAVRVEVDPVDEAVTGLLRLATGYGNQETTVEVTVVPFEGADHVPVDENLGKPRGGGSTDDDPPVEEVAVESKRSGPSVQVVAVAAGAVLLALAVAVLVGGEVVTAGAGVVVVAALVAVLLSLR